ncbi:MAG TPA: hypothetical protein PK231_09710 [Acidocella sp.]|nr:MAG: hypothetical protein B7Z77_07865 [Acidocella sp. 20-58-15]OYY04501.1 MAG: hypothetical protein B7Y73_04070 [Acidocella sp. 35-58-6]HQT39690.1 hypothetical protein [Acidocella sp.]
MSEATEVMVGILTFLLGLLAATVSAVNSAVGDFLTSAGLQPNFQILLLSVVSLVSIYIAFRWLGLVFAMVVLTLFTLLSVQLVLPGMFAVH